jgi:hypothetical protein
VYCEAEFFGEKTGKWEILEYSTERIARNNLIFCSALYRKSDFYLSGGYNINMKYGWEDWDFWIGMLKNGGNVFRIPKVLFYYRVKEQSMISAMSDKKKQMMLMQLYLNHPDFFDKYYTSPIECIPEYTLLKRYCENLRKDNEFLKGLLKLKPSAFTSLFRKMIQR